MNIFGSLFLLALLFPSMSSTNICPISNCSTSYFKIKFPFYTDNHSLDCSYPGFKLSCNKEGLTSIDLPSSGEFLVRNIQYHTQEIRIYDPKSCMAKRLLTFNLSYSAFNSPYYKELTFFTCPGNHSIDNYRVIDCLSNSKNSTLVTQSSEYARSLRYPCQTIGTYKIPVSMPWPSYYNDYIFPIMVNNDVYLTWDWPNCKKCEERGGKCRFDDHHYQVVCDNDPGKGVNGATTRKHSQIPEIVALCITIPAVSFVMFLCLYLRFIQHPRNLVTEEIITIQTPNITPPVRGLDDSTIATYQQVTLGESKRLSGSGDETCVICLSEFCAKDTIRFIPECNHCFHTTCIDEWLRMRGSCPVCRNSPLPAHVEA